MPVVEVRARVAGADPDSIFDVIADFERYPELTEAVRSVRVDGSDELGALHSAWEVYFRNGILRWSEQDVLLRDERRIAFEQTEGDFARFAGEWRIEPVDEGCTVVFVAEFDLGIPTLAYMIDPIAESALRENLAKILVGLIDRPIEFAELPPAPEPAVREAA